MRFREFMQSFSTASALNQEKKNLMPSMGTLNPISGAATAGKMKSPSRPTVLRASGATPTIKTKFGV